MDAELIAIRTTYLEAFCHRLAPRDLEGVPVYVIDTAELFPEGCLLWGATSGALDWIARPVLERSGRWQGRGVAIAINFAALEEADQAGYLVMALLRETLVHELAHAVERSALTTPWDHTAGETALLQRSYSEFAVSDREVSVCEPWLGGHGDRFVRAALHLYSRARNCVASIYDVERLCAGPTYGLSSASKYLAALGDEPQRLKDLPLRDVLATPASAAFTELFQADTEAWHRAAASFTTVSMEKTVFDKLKSALKDRQKGRDVSFQALARRIANGDEPKPDAVESCLESSGRTIEDLESLVALFQRRTELQEQLKQSREAAKKLVELRAKVKEIDAEFEAAEKKHHDRINPLVWEIKSLEAVEAQRHQCEPELSRNCPSDELREQAAATEDRLKEVGAELKRVRELLEDAKANIRDCEYKAQFGSRENFSKESLQESIETYRSRVSRHEGTIAELTKEQNELVAKRDQIYRATVAF